MKSFLLESPWLLVPTLVVIQFVLVAIWSRFRTLRWRRTMLAGFLIGPLLVLAQAWIQTDAERLTAICRQMADAVEAVDPPGFAQYISEGFRAAGRPGQDGLDRQELLDQLSQLLNVYRIEQPRLRGFVVQVDGDQATVRYAATCRVIAPDQVLPLVTSAWELIFARRNGQWRVVDLHPRSTPTFPFTSLDEIPR
ncbi:MAG: nuclear transport factor 2 family protein [Phycisphaerae bacterium]